MRPPRIACPCLFLFFLHAVWAQSLADESTTAPSECAPALGSASWMGPAPPLPALPQQYSMKVEANIVQNGWTTEVEEHFDSINQRASVSLTRNGTTTISIFNFKTKLRYDIYANGSCRAGPTGKDFFGFVTTSKQNRPVMATVSEVFRFGTQFNITYVTQEMVRGIPVSHWTSCQVWARLGARFRLDYYFSAPDYTTASSQPQIPVRAILNGVAQNVDSSSDRIHGVHTFQHIYEFNSFRVGAALNEEVFQIPPGVFCSGTNDHRPLPAIPSQLELSLEVVIPGSTRQPRQERIVYDFRHELQETITTDLDSAGSSLGKVQTDEGRFRLATLSTSVVRDYQAGIVYMTDMGNLSCTVDKMTAASSMCHGQQLLTVSKGGSNFLYQGQTTFRGLLVDTWATERSGITMHVYFLPWEDLNPYQTMVGMFMKNWTSVSSSELPVLLQDALQTNKVAGLRERNDEYVEKSGLFGARTGDQLAWGLQLERLLNQHVSHKIINIFNYRPLRLGLASFQVSQCFPESELSRAVLYINADYATDVSTNLQQFFNSVREILAFKVGVSVLHISDLVLTPHTLDAKTHSTTRAGFTLLGATLSLGSQQKSLTDAKQNLTAAVASGLEFRVLYNNVFKNFTFTKEIYFIDYDQLKASENAKLSSETGGKSSGNDASKTSRSEHNYSQGTIAGIAIITVALAALLCLGIEVLVYKRKKQEEALVSHLETN